MKKTTRILSMLLALVMLVGILPVVVPTMAKAVAYPDDPIREVTYLSDLPFVSSYNNPTGSANNTTTSRDFAWYAGNTAIFLGGVSGDSNMLDSAATLYGHGLGMSPMAAAEDDPETTDVNEFNYSGAAHTIVDISKLNVDTFHAVVGITNKAGQDGSGTGVIFEVYGLGATNSERVAYSDDTVLDAFKEYWTDGDELKPLAASGAITKTKTHTFDVDVSGLKYLCLVVKCAGTSHAYCNSAWGDAYVYDSTAAPLIGYREVTDNTYLYNYGTTPGTNLSGESHVAFYDNNNALTLRTATNNLYIGGLTTNKSGVLVEDGIELGPNNGGSHTTNADAYIVYDVSELNADTFYSAVGLRNDATKGKDVTSAGQYGGIVFKIYGSDGKDADGNDATAANAEYELLSSSNVIYKTMAGEFNVDITGVKYLKLYIRLNCAGVNNGHSSMDSYFVNACVYDRDNDVVDISEDVVQANVKLHDSLNMSFAIPMDTFDYDGHYAQITYGGVTENLSIEKADINGDDVNESYTFTYKNIRAKEMTDTISVTIYDQFGMAVTNTYEDSIQAYCQRLLVKDTTKDQLKTVVADLLNYGAEAQKRFDYKEDTLANDIANLPAGSTAANEYTDTHTAVDGTGDYADCKYDQTNVALQDNLKMKFRFVGLAEGMTAKVTCLDRNEQPRMMYADIVDGIVTVDVRIADIRRNITVTIYDAEGVAVCSVTDSVASYLSRLDANNTDVANALVMLSDSALAYFHPNKVTASYTAYQGSGYLVLPEDVTYLVNEEPVSVLDHDDKMGIVGLRIGGVADANLNDGHPFYHGWVITPRAPGASDGATDCEVVFDLTGMDVDTFYAAVGITNKNSQYMDYNESNGAYGGVICEVWGKIGDGEYELLAESDVIIKTGTGEFTVNIEGYDMIKLVTRANDPRTNSSTDTGWGDACVYKSN